MIVFLVIMNKKETCVSLLSIFVRMASTREVLSCGSIFLELGISSTLGLCFYRSRFLLVQVRFSQLTHLRRMQSCTFAIVNLSYPGLVFLDLYVSSIFGLAPLLQLIYLGVGLIFSVHAFQMHLARHLRCSGFILVQVEFSQLMCFRCI